MTVRDLVRAYQREIQNASDLLPDRAAELLMKLTALIGNVNDELRESDLTYKSVLLVCLSGDEAANRARIRAETSPEYRRMREAQDIKQLCIELIRSLKQFLRTKEEEMRLAR